MYSALDDNELFAYVRKDDELAYTELYNRYWQKLYFLAHKYLKSDADAREIVQEIFFIIWAERRSLSIASFPAYVAAMTRYAVYASVARKKRQAEKLREGALHPALSAMLSELLENRMMLEKISKLSSRLPEKCKLVFIRNKLLDQPLAQVAEELQISPKTAEAHLTKALKIIRGKLGETISCLLF
ncbi:MAG TPA: sigma-70 family RNA polymerase sigma factor [Puia sp.]